MPELAAPTSYHSPLCSILPSARFLLCSISPLLDSPLRRYPVLRAQARNPDWLPTFLIKYFPPSADLTCFIL